MNTTVKLTATETVGAGILKFQVYDLATDTQLSPEQRIHKLSIPERLMPEILNRISEYQAALNGQF